MSKRFWKIFFGILILPYGTYLVFTWLGKKIFDFIFSEPKREVIDIQSPDFKKIWNKKDSTLIKLNHFILETPRGQRGMFEVFKHKSDGRFGGYTESYISISSQNSYYGLTIKDITHNPRSRNKIKKIQFRGSTHSGSSYPITKRKRINWILKNLDKSDFGISEYFENENKMMVSKKKNISTFFNKNMSNLEGKDYDSLLKKYQTKVIEIDRNYIKKFVKISNYLKTKKLNILSIYDSVKESKTIKDFDLYEGFLKNEIYLFNLVLFNSLKMIVSLIEDEMITFYEIYDMFDKLNIFDSNWEIEVSKKLENIDNKLDDLIVSIDRMNMNITLQLQQISLENVKTNMILNKELKNIKSSIDGNGLLHLISTYQLYKINKNTKSLRH